MKKPIINKLREELEKEGRFPVDEIIAGQIRQAQEDKKMFLELIDEVHKKFLKIECSKENGCNKESCGFMFLKQEIKKEMGE